LIFIITSSSCMTIFSSLLNNITFLVFSHALLLVLIIKKIICFSRIQIIHNTFKKLNKRNYKKFISIIIWVLFLEWWHSWKLGVELSVQSVPYSSTLLFNKKIKISYFSVSLKNKKKKKSFMPSIHWWD
jgi:hypothetical protein